MKDLSGVEINNGEIVYFKAASSGDLEFGEVLEVAETSVTVSQLRMTENEDGKQELYRLAVKPEVVTSPLVFVLPGAASRTPIFELAELSV